MSCYDSLVMENYTVNCVASVKKVGSYQVAFASDWWYLSKCQQALVGQTTDPQANPLAHAQ